MIIYLAGPISLNGRLSEEAIKENIKVFKEYKIRLIDLGHSVLDPTVVPKQDCWEDYMKLTIPMVCKSNAILLLPNWQLSRGAIFEFFIATSLNIDILFTIP